MCNRARQGGREGEREEERDRESYRAKGERLRDILQLNNKTNKMGLHDTKYY